MQYTSTHLSQFAQSMKNAQRMLAKNPDDVYWLGRVRWFAEKLIQRGC